MKCPDVLGHLVFLYAVTSVLGQVAPPPPPPPIPPPQLANEKVTDEPVEFGLETETPNTLTAGTDSPKIATTLVVTKSTVTEAPIITTTLVETKSTVTEAPIITNTLEEIKSTVTEAPIITTTLVETKSTVTEAPIIATAAITESTQTEAANTTPAPITEITETEAPIITTVSLTGNTTVSSEVPANVTESPTTVIYTTSTDTPSPSPTADNVEPSTTPLPIPPPIPPPIAPSLPQEKPDISDFAPGNDSNVLSNDSAKAIATQQPTLQTSTAATVNTSTAELLNSTVAETVTTADTVTSSMTAAEKKIVPPQKAGGFKVNLPPPPPVFREQPLVEMKKEPDITTSNMPGSTIQQITNETTYSAVTSNGTTLPFTTTETIFNTTTIYTTITGDPNFNITNGTLSPTTASAIQVTETNYNDVTQMARAPDPIKIEAFNDRAPKLPPPIVVPQNPSSIGRQNERVEIGKSTKQPPGSKKTAQPPPPPIIFDTVTQSRASWGGQIIYQTTQSPEITRLKPIPPEFDPKFMSVSDLAFYTLQQMNRNKRKEYVGQGMGVQEFFKTVEPFEVRQTKPATQGRSKQTSTAPPVHHQANQGQFLQLNTTVSSLLHTTPPTNKSPTTQRFYTADDLLSQFGIVLPNKRPTPNTVSNLPPQRFYSADDLLSQTGIGVPNQGQTPKLVPSNVPPQRFYSADDLLSQSGVVVPNQGQTPKVDQSNVPPQRFYSADDLLSQSGVVVPNQGQTPKEVPSNVPQQRFYSADDLLSQSGVVVPNQGQTPKVDQSNVPPQRFFRADDLLSQSGIVVSNQGQTPKEVPSNVPPMNFKPFLPVINNVRPAQQSRQSEIPIANEARSSENMLRDVKPLSQLKLPPTKSRPFYDSNYLLNQFGVSKNLSPPITRIHSDVRKTKPKTVFKPFFLDQDSIGTPEQMTSSQNIQQMSSDQFQNERNQIVKFQRQGQMHTRPIDLRTNTKTRPFIDYNVGQGNSQNYPDHVAKPRTTTERSFGQDKSSFTDTVLFGNSFASGPQGSAVQFVYGATPIDKHTPLWQQTHTNENNLTTRVRSNFNDRLKIGRKAENNLALPREPDWPVQPKTANTQRDLKITSNAFDTIKPSVNSIFNFNNLIGQFNRQRAGTPETTNFELQSQLPNLFGRMIPRTGSDVRRNFNTHIIDDISKTTVAPLWNQQTFWNIDNQPQFPLAAQRGVETQISPLRTSAIRTDFFKPSQYQTSIKTLQIGPKANYHKGQPNDQMPGLQTHWSAPQSNALTNRVVNVPYSLEHAQVARVPVTTTSSILYRVLTTTARPIVSSERPTTTTRPTTTPMTTTKQPTTLVTTLPTAPPTADPKPPPVFDTRVLQTFMPFPKPGETTDAPISKMGWADNNTVSNVDGRCRKCVFVNDRCLLPDSQHCNIYIECVRQGRNVRAFRRSCALGAFFDRKSFLCVDPKMADCPTDRCREPDAKWYPIEGHCKHYWSCGIREGGSAYAQSECCPDMGGFQDGVGCVGNSSCTESCESAINKNAPTGDHCNCTTNDTTCACRGAARATAGEKYCAPFLALTFDGKKIEDSSNTRQHVGVEGVSQTKTGEGIFNGGAKLVLWRYSNLVLPIVFAVRLRFLPTSNEPRFQSLIANCDKNGAIEPTFELSIDTFYSEVIFNVNTLEGPAKRFKIMYEPNTFSSVDLIYDGERIVGSVNGRSRNIISAGGIETRPFPMTIGECSGSKGFKGLIDDVYIYEQCIPDDMYGIFMSVLE